MKRCPLCGGRIVYQGFNALECATATCGNGRPAAAEGPPTEAYPGQLAQFGRGLATGQQWMEVSTGQLYELTAFGTHSVDLDARFLPGSGYWTKRTVALADLADPNKWRCLSRPASTAPPLLPGLRPYRARP